MTATKTTKPAKDGTSTAYTQGMASESVAADLTPFFYLAEPVGEALIIPMQQTGGSVTSLSSAAITNPTSVLTRPANTTAYAANDLIASSVTAGSVVVPSFAIATSAGGAATSRLRLYTNVTTGWGAVTISVDLWIAAPTFTNGDNGAYAVATGNASWLANFLITLTQNGDGASGAGPLTGANVLNIDLTSGTSVFWSAQILSAATPISGQTFTLAAELLN